MEGEEMVSKTQLTARQYQKDELRQDDVCDGSMHYREGFCNVVPGASEAPGAN